MNYLLLTLGHNSSAIYVDNDNYDVQKIIGYEQERLSGLKGDSQFPRDAINEIIKYVGLNNLKNSIALVSHWFNDITADDKLCLDSTTDKYISNDDFVWLTNLVSDMRIVSKEFTHHDAHAYSAYEFFKYYNGFNRTDKDVACLVCDGFGTNEEVLSLYSTNRCNGITPIIKVYGYKASLALMYQYATSFCGMKENQDEYKFLGYESHIDEVLSKDDINLLNEKVDLNVDYFIENMIQTDMPSCTKCIDIEKLKTTKQFWYNQFKCIYSLYVNDDIKAHDDFTKRCIIAYYVQQTVEKVLLKFLKSYNIENLIVAGGLFYNVKLNQKLAENTKGLFSVMPLAGDQGAAIGLYAYNCNTQFSFVNLCWGKRNFRDINKYAANDNNIRLRNITGLDDFKSVAAEIAKELADDSIVDIVCDNMEFGPRALCHTSTLFLPNAKNLRLNNYMNGRNEVMPCAPVVTWRNAYELFGQNVFDKMVGSDHYMICTHTYKKKFSSHYSGIMHKYPLADMYTGRPQVVEPDELIWHILENVEMLTDYKALVNTSFNVHGRPIVFSIRDILQNYEYQKSNCMNAGTKIPLLYIITTE